GRGEAGNDGRGGSVSLTPLPARTGRHSQGGREAPGVACPQGSAVKGEGEGGGVPLTSCASLLRAMEKGGVGGLRAPFSHERGGAKREQEGAGATQRGVPSCAPLPREWGANGGGRTQEAGRWRQALCAAEVGGGGKEGKKGREGGEKEEGF
ncbi:hypothetical protein EDB85DRAFT_1938643, partial [Lactarius pseudohatsudake]